MGNIFLVRTVAESFRFEGQPQVEFQSSICIIDGVVDQFLSFSGQLCCLDLAIVPRSLASV